MAPGGRGHDARALGYAGALSYAAYHTTGHSGVGDINADCNALSNARANADEHPPSFPSPVSTCHPDADQTPYFYAYADSDTDPPPHAGSDLHTCPDADCSPHPLAV